MSVFSFHRPNPLERTAVTHASGVTLRVDVLGRAGARLVGALVEVFSPPTSYAPSYGSAIVSSGSAARLMALRARYTDTTPEQVFSYVVVTYLGRELVRRPAWDLAPEEVEAGVYAVTIETDMPPLEAPPGAPPHPVPVRARSVGDGRSVALEWEATGAASYRLYAHTRELEANRYPIGHTTETHAVVTDLPGNVYVSVQSVGESGLSRTPLSPPFEVVPTMGAATRPVALRLAPPAGLVLQREAETTVDLRRYVRPLVFDTDWEGLTLRTDVLGRGLTVTRDNSYIIRVEAGTEPALAAVVFTVERDGYVPFRSGFVVEVVDEEVPHGVGERPTATLGGLQASMAGTGIVRGNVRAPSRTLRFDATDFAGAAPEVVVPSWGPLAGARLLPATVDSTGQAAVTLTPGAAPGVALLEGAAGYALVVVGFDTDDVLPLTPHLPPDEPELAEVDGRYERVDYARLALDPARAAAWRRVVAAGRLYDLSTPTTQRRAREVHFAPPVYYNDDTWFDRHRYPPDAHLMSDGRVEYRSGLRTAPAAPVRPEVVRLAATATDTSIDVVWSALDPVSGAVTDRLPASVYVFRGDTLEAATSGRGSVRIDGLAPATTYLVRLFEADASGAGSDELVVKTARRAGRLTVEGSLTAAGTYRYDYVVTAEDGLLAWRDAFGGEHTEMQATLVRAEEHAEHSVRLLYDDGAETVSAATLWTLPRELVRLRRRVVVGEAIDPSGLPLPTFSRRVYGGETVDYLPYNIYGPGRYRAVPEFTMPPALADEEAEALVSAQFVGADGAPLGPVVSTRRPVELAIEVRVAAARGASPTLTGVYVDKEDLPPEA